MGLLSSSASMVTVKTVSQVSVTSTVAVKAISHSQIVIVSKLGLNFDDLIFLFVEPKNNTFSLRLGSKLTHKSYI